jgi:DNA-directed RNA polymerase specialized sigma24 family protein
MNRPSDGVEPSAKGSGLFMTTHWSVVLEASHGTDPCATEALDRLCRIYWRPLYLFVRSSGYDEETAKDLTQAFFERLLEKDYVKDADPTRGHFRSFLLGALKHFLANEWDREKAVKRGGGCRFVPLETTVLEAELQRDTRRGLNPEQLFERRWAMALLDQVHQALEAEQVAGGKAALFSALQVYLTGEKERPPYAVTASQVGMSVEAVRKAVERLRQHYGQLLRQAVAQMVSSPQEIEAELRHLRVVLAR